jgi:outer membrane protein OmpA-like peptidoglycan-associated protein
MEVFMKLFIYATAATILVGVLILAGCITTPLLRGNKAGSKTDEGQTVAANRSSASLMDSQEAQLRESLNKTGVNITRNGGTIHLNMPGHLTFASGSHKIKPGFHEVLNSLARILNEYQATQINICGHTDSVGKQSYNRTLSTIRARRVASYLAAQGIGAERLAVEGLGETKPIASNKTKSGRARNRRVEIEILPVR